MINERKHELQYEVHVFYFIGIPYEIKNSVENKIRKRRDECMSEGVMLDSTFGIIKRHLLVQVPEELDHHNATAIRIKADQYIMDDVVDHVIFDFEKTAFMDSSGLGVLMGRYKKLANFGGRVLAIHVNPRIHRIMKMAGVTEFIEVLAERESVEEANGCRENDKEVKGEE